MNKEIDEQKKTISELMIKNAQMERVIQSRSTIPVTDYYDGATNVATTSATHQRFNMPVVTMPNVAPPARPSITERVNQWAQQNVQQQQHSQQPRSTTQDIVSPGSSSSTTSSRFRGKPKTATVASSNVPRPGDDIPITTQSLQSMTIPKSRYVEEGFTQLYHTLHDVDLDAEPDLTMPRLISVMAQRKRASNATYE